MNSEMNLRSDVVAHAGELIGTNEDMLTECISICQIYNITPEDLRYKIEAFNYRPGGNNLSVTLESIAALRAQMHRNLEKEKKVQVKPKGAQAASLNRSRFPQHMMVRNHAQGSSSQQLQVKREARDPVLAGPSMVIFSGPKMDSESKQKRSYRYMFEKMTERAEALDTMIEELSNIAKAHYSIPAFVNPFETSEQDVFVIGRISHDSDVATTSRLTEAAMLIESSRSTSFGARVPLRFDPALKIRGNTRGAGGISLFPGAIAALKGKNGGGNYFLVTEILALPPLKHSPTALRAENTKAEVNDDDPAITICIACGPYTADTDLTYKPWKSLLQQLKSNKPEVVILIGPFIDSSHPKIKEGDTDTNPSTLFRAQFVIPLRAFLDISPGSIIILVPNIRDIISNQAVYPQSELEAELFGSDSRIHLLPNPARFSLNDISFGVTSVDVLYHIRKQEYLKRGIEIEPVSFSEDLGEDVMANLSRNLLQQRSFYPVFPTPEDLSHEVNLDITHASGLKLVDDPRNDFAPDVLILPSRLKHFTKTVNATVAINPSYVQKLTYVKLAISSKNTSGRLKERLNAEVIKFQ